MRLATREASRPAGSQGLPISDQFNAQEQPRAAHVADQQMAVLEFPQTLQEMLSYLGRVDLQVFVGDDVQHRQADGAGNRVAAEGAEEFHAVVK